ncbi:MAG: rRNA maturation RNase YbeY [Verrucomicrobia bacterium RIFCSPHIGHO2_12_FULL_41_10]|nr:MAG: rRNA maturation RNase YbeY [Verrucomicrobia bacterium RIFCSPHIGHO2_12_FULL_41_10]HLB32759.1 rRNA maturation RNase YbeY [Chthoniobacterales bacterium]
MASTSLFWANRQRAIKLDLVFLCSLVEKALPLCLEKPRWVKSFLPTDIEVTLLSDHSIAKIHNDFLEDPTPTDVITFRHSQKLGEILVGVPTAARNAKHFGHSVNHEVALCVVHGLLHLLDYDDTTESERQRMHKRQEEILCCVTTNVAV